MSLQSRTELKIWTVYRDAGPWVRPPVPPRDPEPGVGRSGRRVSVKSFHKGLSERVSLTGNSSTEPELGPSRQTPENRLHGRQGSSFHGKNQTSDGETRSTYSTPPWGPARSGLNRMGLSFYPHPRLVSTPHGVVRYLWGWVPRYRVQCFLGTSPGKFGFEGFLHRDNESLVSGTLCLSGSGSFTFRSPECPGRSTAPESDLSLCPFHPCCPQTLWLGWK